MDDNARDPSLTRSWQVPPAAVKDTDILGWVDEGVEEGLSWLKMQRTHTDYNKAFNIFSGRTDPTNIPTYRSQLVTARLKRNTREVIGACANIRPIWGYSSDNPAFSNQALMMNKTVQAIYLEIFADRAIKRALQWSGATGTGWIRPVYRRSNYGHGKGNLALYTYGAPSVLPVQLPSDNNWQEAYAINILDELPVAMAHGMFPKFQEQLRPTSSKYWYSPEIRSAAKGNMFKRIFSNWGRGQGSPLSDLYIPIRYTYVNDLTINNTGNMIPMGQPGSSWYYEVPSYGSTLPDGRVADENKARLYPYRRLIISSENVKLYDGPSFDWHGEYPIIPFCLDDWAWEPLGFAITRDGYALNEAIDEITRGVMDKHRSALDMSLGYDINAVTKNEADSFDPMQPRGRIGFDGTLVERPFQPVIPENVLKVDPMTMNMIQYLSDTMDYQMAIRDVVALAKARAMGGGVDDMDKIMEADGPIVRDISRNVERSVSMLGNQVKYLILQYCTVCKIMQYVGADSVTKETFDFDPDSIVPSHMPDELPKGYRTGEAIGFNSKYSRGERARWFADNLSLTILPHSVHEITQMSHKLGLIQMRKAGVQISSQSIAESWDISNFKEEKRRYWEEQEEVAQHAIRVKQLVDSIVQQGVMPTPAMEGALAGPTGGMVPPQEGRPPSGQQAPQLVTKDGGARSTISESGS